MPLPASPAGPARRAGRFVVPSWLLRVLATRSWPPLLLLVGFHDEFDGGLPIAGAAAVASGLELTAAAYAAMVFLVPGILATALEAPVLAWSDGHRSQRRALVVVGLLWCGLAMALEVVALNDVVTGGWSAWWRAGLLSIGVTGFFLGSGLCTGLAEAILVDDAGPRAPQRLAQWTLAGVIGDVAAPLLVIVVCSADRGGAMSDVVTIGVVVVLLLSWVLWREAKALPKRSVSTGNDDDDNNNDDDEVEDSEDDEDDEDDEATGSWRETLRTLKQAPQRWTLLWWSIACALCGLLDETLASLLSLIGHERFVDNDATIWLGCFSGGGAVGLIIVERWLARTPDDWRRLVRRSARLCAVGFVGVLVALSIGNFTLVALCLTMAGAGASPLWPLTLAACHAALPDRPGLVGAVGAVLSPVDMVLPVLLGLVVDEGWPLLALGCLLTQPLGILLIARRTMAPPGPHP